MDSSIHEENFVSDKIFNFCKNILQNGYDHIPLFDILQPFEKIHEGLVVLKEKKSHNKTTGIQSFRYFFEGFSSSGETMKIERNNIFDLLSTLFQPPEKKYIKAITSDRANKHYYVSFKGVRRNNIVEYLGAAIFDVTPAGSFIAYIGVSGIANTKKSFCGCTDNFRTCHIGSLLLSIIQCLTFCISPRSIVVSAAGAEDNFSFWEKNQFKASTFESWDKSLRELSEKYHYDGDVPKIVPILLTEKVKRYSLLANIESRKESITKIPGTGRKPATTLPGSTILLSEESESQLRSASEKNKEKQQPQSLLGEEQIEDTLRFLSKWERVKLCRKRDGGVQFTNKKIYRGYVGDFGENTQTFRLQTGYVEELLGPEIRKLAKNKWVNLPSKVRDEVQEEATLLLKKQQVQLYTEMCDTEWAYIRYNQVPKDEVPNNQKRASCWSLATTDWKQVDFVPRLWFFYWEQAITDLSEKEVVQALKRKCKNKPNEWRNIPVGNFRQKQNEECLSTSAPEIFYRQLNGENTCVFTSLANGLRYCGDLVAADFLIKNMKERLKEPDRITSAMYLLRNSVHKYNPWYVLKKRKRYGRSFDIFSDISSFPTIYVLEGNDGATTHAVTVVDSWVFDSNACYAKPLTQETLDWCCSSIEREVKFYRVSEAVRFQTDKPLRNVCKQHDS